MTGAVFQGGTSLFEQAHHSKSHTWAKGYYLFQAWLSPAIFR